MKQFFAQLFGYNHHMNQLLADVYVSNPGHISEKAAQLYGHILNAHQIWNNRIHPLQKPVGVWQMQLTEEFNSIDKSNYKHSLELLDIFSLDDRVTYANSKGQHFSKSVIDILFHTINHSTYHRGQIATEFRRLGLEPIVSDYILYKQ